MPSIRALWVHGHHAIFGKGTSANTSGYGYQSSRSHRMSSRPKFVNISSKEGDSRCQKQWGNELPDNHSDAKLVSAEKPERDSPDEEEWLPNPGLPPAVLPTFRYSGTNGLGQPMLGINILETHISGQWDATFSPGTAMQGKNTTGIRVSQQWSVETEEREPGSTVPVKKGSM